MKNLLIAFAIGAACGVLAILLLRNSTTPPPVVDTSAQTNQIQVLNGEIRELTRRLAQSEKKSAEIATTASDADADEPNITSKIFRSGNASDLDMKKIKEQMKQHQQKRIDQKVAAQLASLRSRLNLSDDQEAAIREILTRKASASGTAGMISMAIEGAEGGNVDLSSLVADNDNSVDHVAEIRALLNEEQSAAYDDYLADRRANAIESRASQRLAHLQRTLDLSSAQKDQVFDIFSKTASSQVSDTGDSDGVLYFGSKPEEKEALGQVLSPEQMAVYDHTPQGMSILSGDGDIIGGNASVINIGTAIEGDIPVEIQGFQIESEVIEIPATTE